MCVCVCVCVGGGGGGGGGGGLGGYCGMIGHSTPRSHPLTVVGFFVSSDCCTPTGLHHSQLVSLQNSPHFLVCESLILSSVNGGQFSIRLECTQYYSTYTVP